MGTIVNNKKIAKNTALLYIRTFLVMLISIYTSRLVLQYLGVEDYGIYNVVGGLVAMFAVVSNSLSAAISRFITFEIGSGDNEKLHHVFSTSKVVLLVLAIIVVILAEILGIWFMENQMQIPEGRWDAAMCVLQCSIVSFFFNLIAIPYNACVIAHEHMKAFAYFSLLETFIRLGICISITFSPIDRLVYYAVLIMLLSVVMRCLYVVYCSRNFNECRSKMHFYKSIFKEIFGFAGWSFFTSANSTLCNQGVNMLINVFFGVTFNAARGIANQVKAAMTLFVSSFVSAINPQITKSYASGELESMYSLVCRGARFSYFLTLLMVVPFYFEAEQILNLWLVDVPEMTVVFMRLSLINILMDGAGYTFYTANLATGKIKKYSILLSVITFLVFPLSWMSYYFGGSVELAYIYEIVANIFYHIARLFLTQENVGLKIKVIVKKVYIPIFITTGLAIMPSIVICSLMPMSYLRLGISIVVGVSMSILTSLIFGMTIKERITITNMVKNTSYKYLEQFHN